MRVYNKPTFDKLTPSPEDDILQNSGNDPFLAEYDEWSSKGAVPGLKEQ